MPRCVTHQPGIFRYLCAEKDTGSTQVVIHEADEPNVVGLLSHPHILPGKHGAEADFAPSDGRHQSHAYRLARWTPRWKSQGRASGISKRVAWLFELVCHPHLFQSLAIVVLGR